MDIQENLVHATQWLIKLVLQMKLKPLQIHKLDRVHFSTYIWKK